MFDRMSYRTRRRWALALLVIGLPLYLVVCVTLVNLLQRPAFWLELVIYVAMGVLWVLPFRGLFRGIGQPNPDDSDDQS